MKRTIKHIAPWLAAAAIGGAVAFAPVASADSSADPASPSQSQGAPAQSGGDPLVPFGTHAGAELPYNDGGWDPQPAGAV
ncbi:MAG TPA: hypothetical protein VG013_37735 [Gemmataceae bacterium]|jgi:hypothetical protein|nr:hypothetical protein [Gemmataceae bacterium]